MTVRLEPVEPTQVACPECGATIPVTDLLTARLRERVAVELRPQLEQAARARAEDELQQLRDTTTDLAAENKELKRQEHELRREREALARKQEDLDLIVQREVDKRRSELRKETEERLAQEHDLKLREKDEQIRRAQADADQLRQRLSQPSQELQGIVQEMALDERLSARFPDDDIRRVARGRSGADIVQKVRSRSGTTVATILWESKRAKTFGNGWIPTLKDNARNERADAAVLVSSTLPDDAEVACSDGVWVVSLRLADSVAELLRSGLIEAARVRTAAELRGGLAGSVYDYMTSARFRDHVVTAVEGLDKEMRALNRERTAFERRMAEREEFVRSQARVWATLFGDLEGIGAELAQVPALTLPLE
ncbi:MAG TPA: DUF2130 domain-containing protein [Acidimicrobiales bacterium]|nr:DUF2130 domain-containing protein [Acidimicrobiales bacterium]